MGAEEGLSDSPESPVAPRSAGCSVAGPQAWLPTADCLPFLAALLPAPGSAG